MRNPLKTNGILVINKPLDWTSFDVVKKVRNILDAKKVGHTGTLDPKATGVLVLCIGKAPITSVRPERWHIMFTPFYVGTVGEYRNRWIIVGVWYPKKNCPLLLL